MKRLVKTEFYKLCKADHTLLIALLFLYPVMWSVLAYRNEIVLDVKKDCLDTMEKSREIGIRDTRQGFSGSLFCAVLRVFAPLL